VKIAALVAADSVVIVVMALQGVGPAVVVALVTARVQPVTAKDSARLVVTVLPARVAVLVAMALRVRAVVRVVMVLLAHVAMDLPVKAVARVASVIAIVKMPARSANGWRCRVIFRWSSSPKTRRLKHSPLTSARAVTPSACLMRRVLC
jgi:hypothetical protein